MNATSRAFSARLYPRSAVETAARAFKDICDVKIDDEPGGAVVSFVLPPDADENLISEFCNLALVAAVEIHIGAALQ